jgi:hypothetical protein
VSIGLPPWLVNQDSKKLVVLVYVGVLVIFLPILVFFWCVGRAHAPHPAT